ncbi:MAG: hypothetical protein JST43_07480 [Bacteroidetes bacterium]|nr:hypothetical protein [Bacteroidota bacterium]MBS1540889.1 hypothetical protein [Bacteroidota bacterium]
MKIILYLSFHAIGFFLVIVSMLGTPGEMNKENAYTKILMNVMDILLSAAWYGIPFLFLATILAFIFGYPSVGKLCSIISLSLGATLFLAMVLFYAIQ